MVFRNVCHSQKLVKEDVSRADAGTSSIVTMKPSLTNVGFGMGVSSTMDTATMA